MKKIAIFLDGTWNDKEDSSKLSNVALLHQMCLPDCSQQINYYGKGLGTDGGYDKKLGGLHGVGLSRNVKEAYSFLVEHHEENDQVFIFGFSRGAYTARSLAGLIYGCGVMPKSFNISSDVNKLYDAYRDKDPEKKQAYKAANKKCPIHMLGVWDTVGALGIPVSFLKRVGDKLFNFHDTKLNDEVKFACHAIAIDERRKSFQPTLWEVTPENKHRIKQVWFPGIHSDVGGGYAERHHSDIALRWMKEQAEVKGMLINDGNSYVYKDDLKKETHKKVYKVFGIEIDEENREAPITADHKPVIHFSVRDKMKIDKNYKPLALWNFIKDKDTLAPYEIEEKQ
jgi:uncharacterized protein (DUF2235 family)